MTEENGRVPSAPGSREPSPDGLGPSGFDPSRITEMVATIEAKVLAPFVKKAADELYCSVMETAEDYLRDNLDWNLRSHLEMLQRENQRMRTELYEADRIIGGNYLSHADRIERLRMLDNASAERMMLLMAVGQKHDGETRYETALRYIQEREARDSDGGPQGGDGEAGSVRSTTARAAESGIAQTEPPSPNNSEDHP